MLVRVSGAPEKGVMETLGHGMECGELLVTGHGGNIKIFSIHDCQSRNFMCDSD